MFRTSVVHLQERSYAVCCNLVCLDSYEGERRNALQSSSSFTLITTGRIETYRIATYSIRTLLKMDYWSPKHVELPNVMNKINHQICVSCWITDILQNDTRSVQYQIFLPQFSIFIAVLHILVFTFAASFCKVLLFLWVLKENGIEICTHTYL